MGDHLANRCLLRRTAAQLDNIDRKGALEDLVTKAFVSQFGRKPKKGEVASWANSIPTVVGPLMLDGLGGVEVLIEMRHPLTDARIDMVLVGSHPGSGDATVVVVENKQWSAAKAVEASNMVALPNYPWFGPQVHPANQVWAYCLALTNYVTFLENARVYGVVNMHEACGSDIETIQFMQEELDADVVKNVRVFASDQRADLRAFLRGVMSATDAAQHADDLVRSPRRPTRHLMSAVSECVKDRPVFPLLNDQRRVCDLVHHLVRKSATNNRKEVVIVKGGPGTGKSVIALELLGRLNRQGISTVHATGSDAFTGTLREYLQDATKRAADAFTYYFQYAHRNPNEIDVLIADEAHRIRENSNRRFTPRNLRSEGHQVDELINAARVPVFLLDDNQVIRPGEVGSVKLIQEAAERLGCSATVYSLRDQFRCGGSIEYVDWVDRLFGLTEGGPQSWSPVDDFELYLARSPETMEQYLRSRIDEMQSARIAAGFCWPWSKALPDGTLEDDVVIGDWKRPWNSRKGSGKKRSADWIPASTLWATHPNGFGQIGCIYTAQGFEYDHAGVILGPDLVWSSGMWLAAPKANRDPKVANAPAFDRLVRNTYKVLATRAMRSTVIYSTDGRTQEMIADLGVPLL